MWTKENLQDLIKKKLSDRLLVVVSNRQPYIHTRKEGKIVCQRGPGGVITALDPVMKASGGTWVAHASGNADKEVSDKKGRVGVPTGNPRYTLKRVWLNKEEEEGYYYGFSNEGLWPLAHMAFTAPAFREEDWKFYKKVNEKFAKAVLEEVGDKKAFVWVQDYHLALLPKILKEASPNIIVACFWHIPWPSPDVFRICPQKTEILEGLLGSDLLGFHIRYYCDNFLETVERELEAKINRERLSVIKKRHETLIRPYPIGVDFEELSRLSSSPEVAAVEKKFREQFSLKCDNIFIGLDRIDYTKGIPQRLMAIDRLLEKYPEYKEKIVFVQMGQVSRIHLPRYKALNDELNALVEKVNWKHSTDSWSPVILMRTFVAYPELLGFYKLGNFCLVTPVHDGMNLVCKEYLATRNDLSGTLILSQFSGAARELAGAVLINPYDIDNFADKIKEALMLPEKERRRRMSRMRRQIQTNNIYRWAGKVLSELLKIEFRE